MTGNKLQKPQGRLGWAPKAVLAILVVLAGVAGAAYIEKTAPKARRRPPVKQAPLVSVQLVKKSSERVLVQAMGMVTPARQVKIKAQVSGKIEIVHPEFIDGGIFKRGEVLLQIEKEDYELALRLAETNIAASYARNETARENLDRSASLLPRRVISKQKHDTDETTYKEAAAHLEAQMTSLTKAELDLARTKITAPFNGVIRSKNVDVGAIVSPQDQLADLAGADEYHIRAAVPVDRLDFISIPQKNGEPGSLVRIFYGAGHERRGRAVKLLSDLDSAGQMARIIISAPDPLNLKTPETKDPPLLINQVVRVEIEGGRMDGVYRISRDALRDGSTVWVVDENNRLIVRDVEASWRTPDAVYLKNGLTDGERLVISNLAAAAPGMLVRVEGDVEAEGAGSNRMKNKRRKQPASDSHDQSSSK